MRIGRKRKREAWNVASSRPMPRFAKLIPRNSTIRIEFLVTRPTSKTRPIWLKGDFTVPPVSQSVDERPGEGQRDRDEDDDGMEEALELRGEHEVRR